MIGSKRLLADLRRLPALAPAGALSAGINAQSPPQSLWCNDPFQRRVSQDGLNDGSLNGSVSFPGKAAFSR